MAKQRRTPLRVWLDDKGESQRWLAEQLGISDAFVSELLSGKRTPSLELAVKLEDLTGIPARDFAEVA